MKDVFIGDVNALWSSTNHRWMQLTKPFTYCDPKGKAWEVPVGACINGATIPRFLWTSVGPPFVGVYRRATVVHDFHVGEEFGDTDRGAFSNCVLKSDISFWERRKADRMFYHACRKDGASRGFALLLYVGVSLGSWGSLLRRDKHAKVLKSNFDIDAELKHQFLQFITDENASINSHKGLALDAETDIVHVIIPEDHFSQDIYFQDDIEELEKRLNASWFAHIPHDN